MMDIVKKYSKELKKLCQKHHVAEMHAFGSVVDERFSPQSDIDFLIKFSEVDPLAYFDNYMDLKEGLENVFSKKVDLLEIQTLKNPILKESVHQSKVLVYGPENTEVAL